MQASKGQGTPKLDKRVNNMISKPLCQVGAFDYNHKESRTWRHKNQQIMSKYIKEVSVNLVAMDECPRICKSKHTKSNCACSNPNSKYILIAQSSEPIEPPRIFIPILID